MDINIKIGEKVLLDLGTENFIGDVYSIDPNYARIRLKNVENFQTKVKYNGILNFFFSNVKSITPFLEEPTKESISFEPSQLFNEKNKHSIFTIKNENEEEKSKKIFSKYEWDSINFSLDNVRIINQNDVLYFNTIKDLNNEQHFALIMEDCNFGRNNISTVITIYAPQTRLVYVFDMICMQKVYKELKLLLELDKPRKIMFNSNLLCDHLKHVQGVAEINGIFDVLVAYLVTFKDEKSIDLISCIHKCFSIPENYVNMDIKYNWNTRPLRQDHVIFSAKKAIFLHKLHEYFLHDHLLKQFYQTCQIFSSSYCAKNDQVEVAHLMSTNDKTADKLAQETDVDLSFSINRLNLD